MRQKHMLKKKGYDRIGVEIGDLVYHDLSNRYGTVIDVDTSPNHTGGANVLIEWVNGNRTWNFADNALLWRTNADKEKKKVFERSREDVVR